MDIFASWIAGTSVISQDSDVPVERVGWGARINFDPFAFPATPRWFHFAIATPTVIKSQGAWIIRVMIQFKTTGSVAIDRVDLWDGGRGLMQKGNLRLAGDYVDRIVVGENVIELPPLGGDNEHWGIWSGLGVSIHVDPGTDYGDIHFASVGADFGADV